MTRIPIALTIAGSDSGGGAGIQADIKAMSANGAYAASVLTALTAQNTMGVTAILDVPPDFVTAQMEAVFSDIRIDAVKIGMLSRPETIEAVARGLTGRDVGNIVLDPVMVAASGDPLIEDNAVENMVNQLFPRVDLITPNRMEAARLTGGVPGRTDEELKTQAHIIRGMAGPNAAVLLKGGHGEEESSRDLLVTKDGERWYDAPRIDTRNTHGTGCSLSAAIAAKLAAGQSLGDAVGAAKQWLTGALAAADRLGVGRGNGPVHHFHEYWR